MGDEKPPLSTSAEGSSVSLDYGENSKDQGLEDEQSYSQTSTPPDQDFSPQVKRLRTPQPSLSRSPRLGGKRRSVAWSVGSSSFSTPESLMTPQKQSRSDPSPEAWSCGACTYSNSSLLPYCEMCEHPQSSSAPKSGMVSFSHTILDYTSCMMQRSKNIYFFNIFCVSGHFSTTENDAVQAEIHHICIYLSVNINPSSLLT